VSKCKQCGEPAAWECHTLSSGTILYCLACAEGVNRAPEETWNTVEYPAALKAIVEHLRGKAAFHEARHARYKALVDLDLIDMYTQLANRLSDEAKRS
jgi:hypothetical protein